MGCDDGTSKAVTTIETDSITACRSIDFDFACVGFEALRWVFCGNSALEGKATSRYAILRETELLKRCTSCNLYLCSHNINAGNLFGNCVFNLTAQSSVVTLFHGDLIYLHSRINLDKIVAVFLVDKEFSRTSITVVGALGKFDGTVEDGIPSLNGEILCWC